MKKSLKINCCIVVASLLILIILFYLFVGNSNTNVANLTDKWINAVTVNNNPQEIANMFCNDGNLVGTVSQTIRKGPAIKQYFNYFAKLPDIKVLDKKYTIQKVGGNVYLNTAFITWKWKGLDEPIVARMSFLFRDNCIFQLHSSALPEVNKDLRKTPFSLI